MNINEPSSTHSHPIDQLKSRKIQQEKTLINLTHPSSPPPLPSDSNSTSKSNSQQPEELAGRLLREKEAGAILGQVGKNAIINARLERDPGQSGVERQIPVKPENPNIDFLNVIVTREPPIKESQTLNNTPLPSYRGPLEHLWNPLSQMKSINPRSWLSMLTENPGLKKDEGLGGAILGTEWGLKGNLSIGGEMLSLEGAPRDLGHLTLAKSVQNFFNESPPKNGSARANMAEEDKETIKASLGASATYTLGDEESMKRAFEDYKAGKPVTISTGWHKHALEVTLHNGFIAITNRGDRPLVIEGMADLKNAIFNFDPNKFQEYLNKPDKTNKPDKPAKIQIFQIQGEVTEQLFRNLFSNTADEDIESRKEWFSETMKQELKAVPFCEVPKSNQKVGNCSWANSKGGFHAELILLQMSRNLKAGMSPEEAKTKAVQQGTEIFKEWELYHRCQNLESLKALQEDVKKPGFKLSQQEYEALINKVLEKIDSKELEPYTQGNYANTTAPESVKRIRELAAELRAAVSHKPIVETK